MKKIFLHSKTAYVARWNDSTQTYWFSKGEEEFEIPADIVEGSNDWLDKTKEGIKEEIEKGSYVKCISDKAKTTSGKHIVEKGRIVQVLSLERNETFLTVSPANAELMVAAFGPLPDHVSGKYAGTGHHRLSDFELSTEEEFLEQQSLVEEKVSKEKGVTSYNPGVNSPHEIVSFRTTDNEPRVYVFSGNGWYIKGSKVASRVLTTDEVLNAVRGKQLQYHSILRKSDGQVFTIGDTIHSSAWRNENDIDTVVYINPQREGVFSTSKGWYSHLKTASVVNTKKKTKAIPVPAPNRRGAAMAIPEVMMEMPEMIEFDIPVPAGRENNNDAYQVNLIRDTRTNDIYAVRDFSVDGGTRISLFPITHPVYNENEYSGLYSAEHIEDNYTIYAVTRLRDNKIFNIDQQIAHPATRGLVTISYFETTRNGMWVNGIYNLDGAEQAFIADDGVFIPLGTAVYFISEQGGNNMSQLNMDRHTRKAKGILYYSTRAGAEQKLKEINNEKN